VPMQTANIAIKIKMLSIHKLQSREFRDFLGCDAQPDMKTS